MNSIASGLHSYLRCVYVNGGHKGLNIGLYLIMMPGLFAMRQSMLVQCFCVRSVYFRPGGVAGAG